MRYGFAVFGVWTTWVVAVRHDSATYVLSGGRSDYSEINGVACIVSSGKGKMENGEERGFELNCRISAILHVSEGKACSKDKDKRTRTYYSTPYMLCSGSST